MDESRAYSDFLRRDLDQVDPDIERIIRFEEERQTRRFIFIPSESICPLPVRQALGSVFTNIYAEGYPPLRMTRDDEEMLLDVEHQLAYYRRYADRRFYKGADYVNFIECLAQRRCADCFATPDVPAEAIYVNVQPLSGAAANLAAYEAFLEPGDTLMGMDLFQGGHLTHGSEFNVSGRRYKVVSYGVDPKTEHLDYDAILALALERRPKLIVAGFTSYPWAPDWSRFRQIADACGALLMADIAHTAGLVIAGVIPSPVGLADVITFTTHKTICGPRGAVIMTTNEDKAKAIDMAVFPGEQGGPHTNKFAAMAVAFKIAQTPAFRRLQAGIVENARALAASLQSRGLRLAYGGTDTHMLLLDLRAIRTPTGLPLRGEVAVRIMELCGLVANKNTLPGDTLTALASGVRLGTPWLTQRGLGPADMDRLAGMIHKVLTHIHPFAYIGLKGELSRGKIDLDVLEEVRREVDEMAAVTLAETAPYGSACPHDAILPRTVGNAFGAVETESSPKGVENALAAAKEEAVCLDLRGSGIFLLGRGRAKPFIQELSTSNLADLATCQAQRTFLLDRRGKLLADVAVWRLEMDARGYERYLVTARPEVKDRLAAWLRGMSDGYILFDDQDIMRKVQGPVVVEDMSEVEDQGQRVLLAIQGPAAGALLHRLGGPAHLTASEVWSGELVAKPASVSALVARLDLGSAPSHSERYELLVPSHQADALMGAFESAGAVRGSLAVDAALRQEVSWPVSSPLDAVALYRSHPSLFDLTQPYFVGQAALRDYRPVVERPEFCWREQEGEPKRTPLYEAHRALTRKLAPFAGWEMPLWYSSVAEEHRAVRQAAGLFDVAHMGVLEVGGKHAASFLDLVFTNYVQWIGDGQASYGYLMDPDGHVLDDVMVYRRRWDRYLLVVNAINAEKDLAWLHFVNAGGLIDCENPAIQREGAVTIRDLKDPACGSDQLVDLALQGPASLSILQRLADDATLARRIARIRRTEFIETELAGMPLIISRTGYTGEDFGYELFVHPDQALRLWNLLLETGEPLGLKPCGLAARDSLRIEAGLPLYGHDLAGPHDIVPTEAGYAPYVKFHKPYFIGRAHCLAQEANKKMEIVRFRLERSGARAIHQDDPVVNRQGSHIGWVTSCTLIGGVQMGMAWVEKRYNIPGTPIGIFPSVGGRTADVKPWADLQIGDRVLLHEAAAILSRFPDTQEKEGWHVSTTSC